MAYVCDICGKKKAFGNTRKLLRGHQNVTGRRTFKPNLQSVTVDNKHLQACVRCIRTLTKETREK